MPNLKQRAKPKKPKKLVAYGWAIKDRNEPSNINSSGSCYEVFSTKKMALIHYFNSDIVRVRITEI